MERNQNIRIDGLTVTQVATMLGISRVAVHKKIKKGDIRAQRIGNIYIIPKDYIQEIYGKTVSQKMKNKIRRAVHKAVQEYGEVLTKLGNE